MSITFVHKPVGVECTRGEFEDESLHYVVSGTSIPAYASGSLFYKHDDGRLYFFRNGSYTDLIKSNRSD